MLLIYMLIGFTVSLLAVPFFTALAVKTHVLDIPSERKIHIDNIPLLGGLGIFSAYLTAVLLINEFSPAILAMIAANFIIILTGVLDDIKSLNAQRKLVGQIAAATLIVIFTNYRFYVTGVDIPLINHPILSVIITYFWIVGVTNALNLIDGMDGLAGGIAFMAFGAIGYAAYSKGFEVNAFICMGLMGGTLGFLRYNIPPAKVFMGDTGSLFLGFNIAVMSMAVSHKSGTLLSVMIPVMFISLPLFDTALAIFRRTLKGQNPMSADKEHLHHRLLSLEFSSVQTLMIFYSLSIVLMIISIFSFEKQFLWGAILTFVLLYFFFLTLKLFHLFDAGKKIRVVNEKMRKTALRLSKHHESYDLKTRYIDIIAGAASFAFVIKFIWFYTASNYHQISVMLLFITALTLITAYCRFSDIENEFSPFIFFWMFFYVIYRLSITGFTSYDMACLAVLCSCIMIKALVRRQFDLFISNPMELLILFCLMLLYVFSGIPAKEFFLLSAASMILYYSNKVFFIPRYRLFIGYTSIAVVITAIFIFSSSLALLKSHDQESSIALTPWQMKNILRTHVKSESFEAGYNELMAYEQQKPFGLMRSVYRSEAAKLYINLITESLLKGDLNRSNEYFREFLTCYPDLVTEFYEMIRPIIAGLTGLDVRGTGNVRIQGLTITEIVAAYSGTLSDFADMYALKGYDSRSSSYKKTAFIMKKLASKTN